eukprot:NODE_18212_length_286_cov_4.358650_g17044_i0.p2 GENE.NODE_18212_length_286_cov_4.358650_g17044_i0~~NODE_18212_length_286_cov_4.358650_g17044_i0.p2  ORF type:complete len:53 (-),score=1.72 NODE_18212_length_286_cov_4.358650_g17044_i0:22-180(-)
MLARDSACRWQAERSGASSFAAAGPWPAQTAKAELAHAHVAPSSLHRGPLGR